MFLILIEVLVILAIVIFVITQAVIPAFKGTELFPIFNRVGKLEKELAQAKQQKVEAELVKAIEEVKATI